MTIMTFDYARLAESVGAAPIPDAVFALIKDVLRDHIGFGLLTLLRLEPDGEHVTRIFTTDPVHYPLSGSEALGFTAWGDHVLRQSRAFLGRDRAAVRWAFPGDCDLIESLGLGSTMNVPVMLFGRTLGSMNILDAENRYEQIHLEFAQSLSPYLVPCFAALRECR